ncbi:TRAP transporter small permease [Endozoicomonas lisbonensis]|uniref:TRAP transporter small permease protein n=1 Tax=Endozoicomonas lisbonensis TaxID=3120522 RepID=A0ABV2SI34_9GAMM
MATSKLISKLERFEENCICLLFVSMAGLTFYEVLMRFAFNTGLMWVSELTLHVAAWFVLFGAAYGVKKGSRIKHVDTTFVR